jgi:hypothetical protein
VPPEDKDTTLFTVSSDTGEKELKVWKGKNGKEKENEG